MRIDLQIYAHTQTHISEMLYQTIYSLIKNYTCITKPLASVRLNPVSPTEYIL